MWSYPIMKTSQLHKSSFEIYVKIPCPAKVGGNSKQEYKVKFIFDQKDQWWPFPDLSRAREGRQEEGTVTLSQSAHWPLELQTKVSEDYVKISQSLRIGPY